jgi:hypothetical protein
VSRERSGYPRRLAHSDLIAGLKYLRDGEDAIERKAYRAATLLLWSARDYFTRSQSLEAPGYRDRANELLNLANQELQKELASNA